MFTGFAKHVAMVTFTTDQHTAEDGGRVRKFAGCNQETKLK